MKDNNNIEIKEGDIVFSSYGIPPVYIEATVVRDNIYGWGCLVCLTPGHNPERCTLADFKRSLGNLWVKRRAEESSDEE